jgi:hypothetical protein
MCFSNHSAYDLVSVSILICYINYQSFFARKDIIGWANNYDCLEGAIVEPGNVVVCFYCLDFVVWVGFAGICFGASIIAPLVFAFDSETNANRVAAWHTALLLSTKDTPDSSILSQISPNLPTRDKPYIASRLVGNESAIIKVIGLPWDL